MSQSKRALKKFKTRKAVQNILAREQLSKDIVVMRDNLSGERNDDPKGMPGGRCNVTSCQAPNSAICLNVGQIGGKHPDTGGCYYCIDCAQNIDEANQQYAEQDQMTMFPTLAEVNKRYREIWKARDGRKCDDFENYKDIDQNPWGSCYHRDRDKYLLEQLELTEAGPRGLSIEESDAIGVAMLEAAAAKAALSRELT